MKEYDMKHKYSMKHKIEYGIFDSQSMASQTIHPYGCVLLRCVEGYARLSINHKPYLLRRGELCVLTSDFFMSALCVSDNFSARYMFLPEGIFNSVYYQITNISLWAFLVQTPVLRLTAEQRKAFDKWLDLQEWTVGNMNDDVSYEIVTSMTCNLFKTIDNQQANIYNKVEFVSKNSAWTISVKFFTLLYKYYKEHRTVDFYADKLNISADYLNKVMHHIYGVAPKRFINDQLTEDIKFRLAHTGQSVKEISQQLHFEDTSYLSRFFRKQTGMSPIAYRNQYSAKVQV